jgi:hypothetical protein
MNFLIRLALVFVCLVGISAEVRAQVATIDLYPPEQVMWTPRNVIAGVTSVFGLYNHWYGETSILVETVPADAEVSLYYLRGNFQKRFERVEAPVLVQLPSRIDSSSLDTFRIRVSAPGYLVQERRWKVHRVPSEMLVELAPLPNALTFLGQTHIGNRTTLTLRTSEEPQVRMSRGAKRNGFTIALIETANTLENVPDIKSGFIDGLEVQQLGEDLVVRVATTSSTVEVRSRSSRDPIRKDHVLTFDLVPKGARLLTSADISRELSAVRFAAGERCGARFEAALRKRLDPRRVARSFRGSGAITGFYQKEAMRKLGRLDRGRVYSMSGEVFRIGSPVEFEMAMQSALNIRDYLALLGSVARTRDDPATFLRSTLSPDAPQDDFAESYREADGAYRDCR